MPKAASTKISATSSKRTSRNPKGVVNDHLMKPKVMSRTFIGKHIVLLHCEGTWNADEIRLQYRDGTSLPRPNMIGFKLIDCCRRREQGWNGMGEPMVYTAELGKTEAYSLTYNGREVWSCEARPLGEEPRAMTLEEAQAQWEEQNGEGWKKLMHYMETVLLKPVKMEIHEDDVLLRKGDKLFMDVHNCGRSVPEGLFWSVDTENAHRLRESKRRTGRTMRM
ncbi:hypothetical protein BD626DRAFT_478714 [Schizophyllum amplum]|uniref:Uncharacterized protein n=1 Tax=Schizophyllum amplum TaxID=97359 RepID=A0A550CRH4_9AGAR|nr:hypothetical protein BD626DRAFT_478714 [Auriculariopsis ampla]